MEWIAYYSIEPFGEEREDLRIGILASTIANVNRNPKQRPYKPQDFMPKFESKSQTWQEQYVKVEILNTALHGQDLRGK